MQTAKLSTLVRMRLIQICEEKQSWNKCFVAKASWTELRWNDIKLQHLVFDSMEELSQQGYFQWIYSLWAVGTPEISVRSSF